MFGRGRKANPKVQERSGGPGEGMGGVGRGRLDPSKVREGSGSQPEGPGGVRRPTQRTKTGPP